MPEADRGSESYYTNSWKKIYQRLLNVEIKPLGQDVPELQISGG